MISSKEPAGPAYFNASQLGAYAGVSARCIRRHVASNTGGLASARETVPGVGVVYRASKCAKFLALMGARKGVA